MSESCELCELRLKIGTSTPGAPADTRAAFDMASSDFLRSAMVNDEDREAGLPSEVMERDVVGGWPMAPP